MRSPPRWQRLHSPTTGTNSPAIGSHYPRLARRGNPYRNWALRFWPDVRPLVDDLVDIEAPNHGTLILRANCLGGACFSVMCQNTCAPALWQQGDTSKFTAALNSGQETFPGISYTNIYSHTSQAVQPNLDSRGSTSLHGGGGAIANIATQDICPANMADHMAYYYDPVAWALIIDALTHPGPADPARIDRSVCLRMTMPYISAGDIPTRTANAYNELFVDRKSTVPQTISEPPLKCYVTATCPLAASEPASPAKPAARKRRARRHRRAHHRARHGRATAHAVAR